MAEAEVTPTVGSVSSSYDNAMAETINGLYKTEVIQKKSPWKNLEAVEAATLEWVSWLNTKRLLEPLGYMPPAEFKTAYYKQLEDTASEL